MTQTVVSDVAAVAGDRGCGLADGQRAVIEREGVVTVAARWHHAIATHVGAGTGRADARQHTGRFAVHQARSAKPAHALAQTVVSDVAAVAGDGGCGLVDGQRAVIEREVVVTVAARWHHAVAARVGTGTVRADARQHAGRFAVYQARSGKSDHALAQTVVSDVAAVAGDGDGGCGLVDGQGAIGRCEIVVSGHQITGTAGDGVVAYAGSRSGGAAGRRAARYIGRGRILAILIAGDSLRERRVGLTVQASFVVGGNR